MFVKPEPRMLPTTRLLKRQARPEVQPGVRTIGMVGHNPRNHVSRLLTRQRRIDRTRTDQSSGERTSHIHAEAARKVHVMEAILTWVAPLGWH